MFDAPINDSGHAPWIHLRNTLAAIGYEIQTSYRAESRLQLAKWVLFMNCPSSLQPPPKSFKGKIGSWLSNSKEKDLFQRCLQAGLGDQLALFLWEPEVVVPENFEPSLHRNFARIFTWHRQLLSQQGRYREILYPQASGLEVPESKKFAERKLLVNFSGNKTSPHSLELYSQRVEVIRYMESNHSEDFDHYGPGWEYGFPLWRGVVPSKHTVYPQYRFGLCYENMHGVDGYVTEKIFDCLRAGAVPVYWGAPDIESYVPADAFVDRRRFASTKSMIDYLNTMQESEWQALRSAGLNYLSSVQFSNFLPAAFAQRIINGLELEGAQ
jgi:hypothetical protein